MSDPLYFDFPYLSEHFGYVDHFDQTGSAKEPFILEDGTSERFSKDWTDEDADKWRQGMALQRPDNFRVSTHYILH